MAEFNYKSFSAAAANAQDLQCSLPDQTTLAFDEYARIHWDKALSDGIFRYKLDDTTTRSLDGQYGFVVQNNPKRFTHRRTPHEMASISEPFSPDKFHFNKIKQNEVLFTVNRQTDNCDEQHLAIANVSPIDYCHFLLVPHSTQCLPQVITEDTLTICLELLSLTKKDDMCLVANSLLAYASVNHLHYHFLNLNYPLLAKRLIGMPLNKICYQIVGHPMNGFAFQMTDNPATTSQQVYHIIRVLLQEGIPHNLFVLKRSRFDNAAIEAITVFLIPRKPATGVKTIFDEHKIPPFFVAACEIGGFIPIIDQTKYSTITEEEIVQTMVACSLTNAEFEHLKSIIY